jgi:hypothetical protein
VSLLCLPLARAAGRFGVDAHDGIAVAGVGMQDLTPMASTKAGSLISEVLIGWSGHNTYRNIRTTLSNLGITNRAVEPHKDHFHIYLKPPKPLDIGGGAHLLEATDVTNEAGFSTSCESDIVMDVQIPYEPVIAVMAQQASASQLPNGGDALSALTQIVCQDVENDKGNPAWANKELPSNTLLIMQMVPNALGKTWDDVFWAGAGCQCRSEA